MRKPRRSVALAALAGTALAACTGVGSAVASPGTAVPQIRHVTKTLPGDYIAPLQFAVHGHDVYVADSGASALFKVGKKAPIARGPAPSDNPEQSGDLAGVDVRGSSIGYTETQGNHRNTYLTVLRHGKRVLRVNLGRYERQHNPDGKVTYGATGPVSDKCAATLMQLTGQAPTYTGPKDSHAYAVKALPGGAWLVADAGGNDILKVSRHGHIRTVAVLPAQPVVIPKELSPDCAGITYRFEAVPTDVETGPKGLYVTTLPGGAGGAGSVYTIGGSGKPKLLATGFPNATNVAVSPAGRVFVVELGVGVFRADPSGPKLMADLPGAAAVEWANRTLWASTAPAVLQQEGGGGAPSGPPPAGHIVRLDVVR